jgi:hypothetical protein
VTVLLVIAIAVLSLALAGLVAVRVREKRSTRRALPLAPGRIVFPFAGRALSQRALDAALRLSRAEEATLVPVFLARVPLTLPLDTPLPRQCDQGVPLLETIEQRAYSVGVPVDSRIWRGRTYRHALREVLDHERYDRIIVAAATQRTEGFDADDVAWLLDHAPGEIVVVRPAADDRVEPGRRAVRSSPIPSRSSAPVDELAPGSARVGGLDSGT